MSARMKLQKGENTRMLKIAKLIFLLIFITLPILAYFKYSDKLSAIFEQDAPLVKLQDNFSGIGLSPRNVKLYLSDKGSGLDSVSVKIEQGNKSKQLFSKNYKGLNLSDEIEFEVKAKEYGFKEGEASLKITIFDKSFFSNLTKSSIEVKLDFTKPHLSVFEDQHNASTFGSELVFYRLKENALKVSGVKYENQIYRGYPAKQVDGSFESKPDVFVAFFPIPDGVSTNDGQLKLYAEDQVGNTATADFFYRVSKQTYRTISQNVDALVLSEKLKELQASKLEENLTAVFANSSEKKLWIDNFSKVPAREVKGFGQSIVYSSADEESEPLFAREVLYTALLNAPISATNNGKVVFAEELPIYGKTLIVDHGLGFSSVYSGLNKFLKDRDAVVERGELIGLVGNSGFSLSPQLRYQIRLHGVSVKPSEWSDPYWVRDHLEVKINNAK